MLLDNKFHFFNNSIFVMQAEKEIKKPKGQWPYRTWYQRSRMRVYKCFA